MFDDVASLFVEVKNNNRNSSPAAKPDGIRAQSAGTSTTPGDCARAPPGNTTPNPETTSPNTTDANSTRKPKPRQNPKIAL